MVVGIVTVGGLGATAYYSIGKSDGINIENHISSKGRKLISQQSSWEGKEAKYKRLEDKSEDLIGGVENKDSKKTPVWKKLEKWCTKSKQKLFIGIADKIYQLFSQWCLEESNIGDILKLEVFKEVSKWDNKVKECNKSSESCFIAKIKKKGATKGKPEPQVEEQDMTKECTSIKEQLFKHELDQSYLDVKKWCFEEKEKPEEVKQK